MNHTHPEAKGETDVLEVVVPVKVEQSAQGLSLPVSIVLAALLISGSMIYLVSALNKNKAADAPLAGGGAAPKADYSALLKVGGRDVILGNPNAPVTLIEYGDYQCPFCGRFFQYTEPLIRENYVKTDKVRMVYRDLAFLGPESLAAGSAAECAKDQGKFWAYHDVLFTAEIADGQENNGNLTRDLFLKLASQAGLDAKAFTDCYDSKKYESVVKNETKTAQAAGVNATPTSFVNNVHISGAQPYDSAGTDPQLTPFKRVIDQLLK